MKITSLTENQQILYKIQKINKEAIKYGSFKITNLNSSYFLPVTMPNNSREENIGQIRELLI